MRGPSLLLLLALILAPLVARAQTGAERIAQGVALREDGRDEEALALFESAYQDEGSGEALAQIALAEHALGRLVEAEAHLVSALAETSDRFVRRNRTALEQALEELRGGLGDLQIQGGAEGAEVWIGDVSRGILPLAGPIRVELGTVRVELRTRGSTPVESVVEVTAGELASLDLTPVAVPVLVPEPVEPAPAAPPPSPPPPARSDSVLLPVGIGVAGLGVVLVGVATGLMVVREDSARTRLTCTDSDPACRAQFQTAVDAETAGIALYAIGGAAIVGGAVLVLLDVLGGESDERSAFACAPGALSLSCAGRF